MQKGESSQGKVSSWCLIQGLYRLLRRNNGGSWFSTIFFGGGGLDIKMKRVKDAERGDD